MKESDIERKVAAYCKKNGLLTYKFVSPSSRGVPDRIIMGRDRILFLELKQPNKKPTALQEHEINRINQHICNTRASFKSPFDGWGTGIRVSR